MQELHSALLPLSFPINQLIKSPHISKFIIHHYFFPFKKKYFRIGHLFVSLDADIYSCCIVGNNGLLLVLEITLHIQWLHYKRKRNNISCRSGVEPSTLKSWTITIIPLINDIKILLEQLAHYALLNSLYECWVMDFRVNGIHFNFIIYLVEQSHQSNL